MSVQGNKPEDSVDQASAIQCPLQAAYKAFGSIETRSLHIPIVQYTESTESVIYDPEWMDISSPSIGDRLEVIALR